MTSYSFDEATLAAAAGVDPWSMQKQLATGDPAQIESLAAAFFKASHHLSEASAASRTAQAYVKQGYRTQGSSPLDVDAEAERQVKDPHIRAAHTAQIAKILQGVGTDLDHAATTAATEVTALDARVGALLQQFRNTVALYHHTGEDRDPSSGEDAALQGIFTEAVAATRSHGATVRTLFENYENSLQGALRSMADLGYIPPDPVDEGPGDINPSTADGTKDGTTTIAAIGNPDHVAGVRQFDTSTAYVDLLNRKMKADGRLTDAEYTYLWQYNNTIDGHLPQIDAWLHDRQTAAAVHEVDGIPTQVPHGIDDALHARGRIVADGVLNLTTAAEQNTDSGTPPHAYGPGGEQLGRGGVGGLPPSLQHLVSMDLGAQVPNDPKLAPDPAHPGTTLRAQWDPKTHSWVVAGQSTATGFTDLLSNYSSDDVTGGAGFSTAMGQAAVRWKQELNTIDHNTHAYYEAELEHWSNDPNTGDRMQYARRLAEQGDPDGAAKYLQGMGWPKDLPPSPFWTSRFADVSLHSSDVAASNALTVSAHNSTGAANLLLDPGARRAVIGLNWGDGDGAAKALVSGTAVSQDPNAVTNQAAKAVMTDVGSDWQGLDNHFTHPSDGLSKGAATQLTNALTAIGVQHIDSFGFPNDNADPNSAAQTVTIAGHPPLQLTGINLSSIQQKGYLEFVSGLGDANYSVIQHAGLERGAQYMASVLHAGLQPDDKAYQAAWHQAEYLNGHIAGAGDAQLLDAASHQTTYTTDAFVDAHKAYRTALADYESKSGVLGGISTILDVGSTVAGVIPGGEGVSAGLGYVNQGLGYVSGLLQPPDDPTLDPKYLTETLKELQGTQQAIQATDGAQATNQANTDWMAARALQLTGHENLAPGVFSGGHIALPTGYDINSATPVPGQPPNVSLDARAHLRNVLEPKGDAADSGPTLMANTAYGEMTGASNPTPGGFVLGYGSSDSADPYAPGGSWGDGKTVTALTYGDHQRVDWTYGLNSQDKYYNSKGATYSPHPLLDQDTSALSVDPQTGEVTPDDPRVSVLDHPR